MRCVAWCLPERALTPGPRRRYVTYGNQVAVDSGSCSGVWSGNLNFRQVSDCSTKVCSKTTPPQSILHYTSASTQTSTALLVFGENGNGVGSKVWQPMCDQSLDDILAGLNASGISSDDVDLSKPLRCETNEIPCLQTRVAALLHSFFYNFWFFGAIYYWAEWLACLVYFIALIYFTCKRRKSIVQAMINDVQSDFDDSDDDMTPFKPSWAS